jgi:hypothetical protein
MQISMIPDPKLQHKHKAHTPGHNEKLNNSVYL